MSNKTKGIIFIILSAFSFAGMSLFVKLSGDLPFIQKSFFRNVIAMAISLFLVIKSQEKIDIPKGSLLSLIVRSSFGTLGIFCNFYAVDHLVLADASLLNKLSPFFAIIFSYLILKEKLNIYQATLVVVAFVGSLFVIKPTFQNSNFLGTLIGLLGGMSAGLAYTFVRILGDKKVSKTMIVFFFSTFSSLICLPFLVFNYQPMSWYQFMMLILAGIFATMGQFAITSAYTYAKASQISIYDYTQIIFATLFGFIFFNQVPDIYSWLGYLIIVISAVIMFFYNMEKWPSKYWRRRNGN